MTKKEVVAQIGLEARYAALFVQTASKFNSKIQVGLVDKVINAKSIMGIISLSILTGDAVTVTADGDDEEKAVDELCSILVNGEKA